MKGIAASTISASGNEQGVEFGDVGETMSLEERIEYLEDAIQFRTVDAFRVSDLDSVDALKFLDAVSELQLVERNLRARQANGEEQNVKVLLVQVDILRHNAMMRLEEDLVDLLEHHNQPVRSNTSSFRSEDGLQDDFSVNSMNDGLMQARMQGNESHETEEYLRDLVDPRVIPDIKRVARLMFTSGYDVECCQSYIAARKDALDEYLSLVCMEGVCIEDVLEMEWRALDRKISRWIKVMKHFIRVYLPSEKHLCELIFGELSNSLSVECFFESVKDSIMQLLGFAEGVALLAPSEEKVFRVLDVYETLLDLLQDIEVLDLEDSGLCIKTECQEIASRLSSNVRVTFEMLKERIRNESSAQPPKGGYHHISRYVMNFLQLMVSYQKPVSSIFGCSDSNEALALPADADEASSGSAFSIHEYFVTVVSILESNLKTKSCLYQSPALRHLFMMNNISYIVRKVKDNSELAGLFGDVWLKSRTRKFRSHANEYQRESWLPVISILADHTSGTKKVRDKLKDFNHAFEEVYMIQTEWQIPDERLRDDLRIAISEKVVPVYRTFMGKHSADLDGSRNRGKYVKHSPEAVQDYLYDLFEGSSKSLPRHQ